MNVVSYPGQILYEVDGQVKFSSISGGQQPWKDGSLEITAFAEGEVRCAVKPKYGWHKKFKLSKSTIKNITLNSTNLLIHLVEGGNIRIQTKDESNKRKLPKLNKLLENVMKDGLKCNESQLNHSFSLSPTSGNLVHSHHNNVKTPVKDQRLNSNNPMTTPTSVLKFFAYDGPNSADSDIDCGTLPLFDDVRESDDLDKENVDSNQRLRKPESVFHKRKESGGSLFMESFEENKKLRTPSSSVRKTAPTFYSRGKQMLHAASQNFLEKPSTARKPQLLGSPKKNRLGDGIFKSWQEKPKLFTSNFSQPKLRGFSNLGNTCYMNAILQSLFSLQPFVDDVLNNGVYKDMPRESLYKAVFQLIQAKKKDKGTSEIQQLLRCLKGAISNTATRFSGYLQHDAHEFLCQCLDQLKEDVLKLNKNATSLKDVENTKRLAIDAANDQSTPTKYPCAISRNFEFSVLHTIQCNKCKEIVNKSEICHDLSLDIPKRRNSVSRASIQTALDQFFQMESLEYTCEECGCKESTVTHSFTKLPRVLILQLKRYSFDVNSAHKVCQSIVIPSYMTLARHCTEDSEPAKSFSCQRNKISMKPEIMSPGPAEESGRLARKRLSYEINSSVDTSNGFAFKRKKLIDTDADLPVVDLTIDSDKDDKGKENSAENKPVEEMSEDEQLAFVIEMSRKESARKTTPSKCEMTEEDQLAMVLELSKHETTFTPQLTPNRIKSTSQLTTPKSAFDKHKESNPVETTRKQLYFDGSSKQRNRDSGISLNLDSSLDRKSIPTGTVANDSGLSMEGVEPLLPDGRAVSQNGTCTDNADVRTVETEHQSSQERKTMSPHNQTLHNYRNDTPLNEEDEALAIERALELSLQEFEEKSSRNNVVKHHHHGGAENTKDVEYTKEEEEELERNYEDGQMPHSYKLLSIVSHIGSTSAIGHYVSDVCDHKKASWYSYDDSEVLRTTAKRVQELRQKNGYIFFYMDKNLCE